jgi:hypothetical protein
MQGVREYAEGNPVRLQYDAVACRLVIVASNEGGYNEVAIDLLDLVEWLRSGGFGDHICFEATQPTAHQHEPS